MEYAYQTRLTPTIQKYRFLSTQTTLSRVILVSLVILNNLDFLARLSCRAPLRSLLAWSHTGTPYRITPNKSSQTVILSAAKDLHVTAYTFGMKLHQVLRHFEETKCTFAMKLLQVTGARQQSSARTAPGLSRPQRLTCWRRMPYFPATVPLVWIAVPL
jgi:hypothetical protein